MYVNSTRRVSILAAAALMMAACGGGDDSPAATLADDAETEDDAVDIGENGEDDEHDEHDEPEIEHEDVAETADDGPTEHDHPQRRLIVADAESPALVILDLTTGDVVGELLLDGEVATHGAALTADARHLLAPHDDGVTIIDGGVWSDQHGNHAHHYSATPQVVGRVDGPNPSHLVSAEGRTALFYDGDGGTIVLDDAALHDGDLDTVTTISTGEPHHGFSVPAGDDYVVTIPTDDMGDMPAVVGVADAHGDVTHTYDCENTHGEAHLPGGAAAACQDGVLVITSSDGGWDGTHVGYPEVDDADPYGYGNARAWVLFAPSASEHLVAPLGSHHVLIVDPAAATAQAFGLDADVALFGVGADADGRLLVLTGDGTIRALDPEDGNELDRTDVVDPFSEGDPGEPHRRLTVSGDHAYVSDPATRSIVEVALADLEVTRTFELDVVPGYLGVLNG